MTEASSSEAGAGTDGAGAVDDDPGPEGAACLGAEEVDGTRRRGGVGDSSGILGRDLTTVESLIVPKLY